MKFRLFSAFISVLILLIMGYQGHAQQGVPGGGLAPAPMGQSGAPFIGQQFSTSLSQTEPQRQGYSVPGRTRSPGIQPQPYDVPQVNRRPCGWVGLRQQPSSPPTFQTQTSPQAIPIQGSQPASQMGSGQRPVDQFMSQAAQFPGQGAQFVYLV